jgi:hypothetical protein
LDECLHVEVVSTSKSPEQMMNVGPDAPAPGTLVVQNLGVYGYAQTVAFTFDHPTSIARQEFSRMP